MNRIKRIAAFTGVVFLAGLYLLTLCSALINTPFTQNLFQACLFSTIAVPCFLYAVMLIYKVLKKQGDDTKKD